jgi:uncharacterized protein with HEPN domain
MNEVDREWLTDMLEHARKAVSMLGPRDVAQLDAEPDKVTLYAVSYCVSGIGEAAGRVSSEGQAEFPTIPWGKVIGMRHRIVHGYRTRSTEVLVDTVRERLPPLIAILTEARVEEDE